MLRKTRIAVLVSGGGTNLQALIDAQTKGILASGKIVLVLSNKADAYALTRAEKAGIATATILKKDFSFREAFEDRILSILKEHNIELVILAGFLSILGARFISSYPKRILNVHPSLIPSFCGAGFYGLKVHEAALAYGVKVTGATVHFVNEIPDGGKIIMQKAVYIDGGDTPESLQKKVMREAEWVILPLSAEKISQEIMKGRE